MLPFVKSIFLDILSQKVSFIQNDTHNNLTLSYSFILMNSKRLVVEVKQELLKKAESGYDKKLEYFFTEPISSLGVRTPKIRECVKVFQKKHSLSLSQTLELSEELLKLNIIEISCFAIFLTSKHRKDFTKTTFKTFERWLQKYVTNWAVCDSLCPHEIGCLIEKFPELKSKVFSWHKSKNRWLRRASMVSYVLIARKKDYSSQVVKTAKQLIEEQDDLVRKGIGWTLRESAKANKKPVVVFLQQYKLQLPRITLRYAIERFTEKEKKELMKK